MLGNTLPNGRDTLFCDFCELWYDYIMTFYVEEAFDIKGEVRRIRGWYEVCSNCSVGLLSHPPSGLVEIEVTDVT